MARLIHILTIGRTIDHGGLCAVAIRALMAASIPCDVTPFGTLARTQLPTDQENLQAQNRQGRYCVSCQSDQRLERSRMKRPPSAHSCFSPRGAGSMRLTADCCSMS